MSYYIFILYFITKLSVIYAARILAVFPTPSISHQVVFGVLTNELVRLGHEVVVITADPVFPKGKTPTNLTEIDVHDISYDHLYEIYKDYDMVIGKEMEWITIQNKLNRMFHFLEAQIKSDQVQDLLRKKKEFDIILIEAYVRPAIVFSHLYKAPVILLSSYCPTLENLETVGAPTHPILYPALFRQRIYNISIWDKLKEYSYYFRHKYLQKHNEHHDDKLLQRIFVPSIPSVTELNKNVEMILLNVHSVWVDNQPMPPNVILIGGIHQKSKEKFPQNLKSYLDSSKNGVIYVSFGTNVLPHMFPPERLKVIVDAFSELPYDILFKWNEQLSGRVENIKTSNWFPQSDLLKHPKVKAFVMQGGLQSTDEAITAGVPIVCIPMLADQFYNAEKYVYWKIGVKLDFYTLTKPELKNAIEAVVLNKSYRENIVKLRDIINDQPQTPLERAIWWIEYVLRHGGARHLRTPAANMSWADYYELDLILIVLSCLFVCVSITLIIIILIWRHISRFVKNNLKTNIS